MTITSVNPARRPLVSGIPDLLVLRTATHFKVAIYHQHYDPVNLSFDGGGCLCPGTLRAFDEDLHQFPRHVHSGSLSCSENDSTPSIGESRTMSLRSEFLEQTRLRMTRLTLACGSHRWRGSAIGIQWPGAA